MAKWVKPFPDSTLTGHFGKVRTFKGAPSNPHRGTDWAPGAKPIPAIADGTIKVIKWSNIMGWGVVQTAWDGKVKFIGYHHLDCPKHKDKCKGDHENPFPIKVGDKVEAGKAIPGLLVGNTGSASSGRHLHATLSNTELGGWSGQVFDLYKAILDSSDSEPKATQETKHDHECKHCGEKY